MKYTTSIVFMLTVVLVVGLTVGSLAQAQGYYGTLGYLGPQPQIESRANVFGGRDYYQGSRQIGSDRANVFGGRDFYNSYGGKVGSSRANVFGGESLYDWNY